jgi:hypothetical protein
MNSLAQNTARSILPLEYSTSHLQAFEETEIPVYGRFFSGIQGFQFDLNANPDLLQILSLRPGTLPGMTIDCIAPNEQGGYRVSWFYPENISIQWDETPLFYVRVRANASGPANLVLLNSRIPSEAYLADGTSFDLDIQNIRSNKSDLKVMEPQPNPASSVVHWPIHTAAGMLLELNLYNIQGQQVYRAQQTFDAGQHQWFVPVETFKNGPLYLWQIRSNEQVFSGKIMFD